MDPKELRGLYEAYQQVNTPQEVDEAVKGEPSERRKDLAAERRAGHRPLPAKEGEKYASHKLSQIAYAKRKRMGEELDIFDVVLEFLQAEGYAETLEEAEWMMANIIDEEAIDIILGEAKVDAGLTPLQKIRKRNKAYSIPGEPAGQQTSNRRAERSSTRGQKKERGAKSAFGTMRNVGGPYKEEYVGEAQEARNNPEKYEREQSKKTAPVRGERTPMPPRGDKRREDFEKWYAKQMGR